MTRLLQHGATVIDLPRRRNTRFNVGLEAARMHVAIVTETWPPEINGVALTVQSLVRGLATLGHSIQLVRPRQAGDAVATPDVGHEQVLLRGASLPRYAGLRFGLPAHRLLRKHWDARRPDAIYIATEGPLGLTALGAARRLGIPACTGFHTRFDDFARHYGLGMLAPMAFAYLRRFHNRASATLVPTTELADFLDAAGFHHVRVLRRAVDTQLFHPRHRDVALRAEWGVASDQLAIMHVGRLAAEKNLDLAVRAFRAIQQRERGARLIMVGDGPARAALAARHPDIVFAGMRRGDDLARHYASGDVFLFPSLTETFGNVTLEALASGLPVVAFDYGAAREHLRDARAGTRVPRNDDDGFAAAAVTLASRVADNMRRAEPGLRDACRGSVLGLGTANVATCFAALLGELATIRAA